MRAKRTPGRWHTNGDQQRWADNYARLVFAPGAEPGTNVVVAAACDLNNTERDAEVDANAHLLAAAPAMYDALKLLIQTDGHLNGCKRSRAYGCTVACLKVREAMAQAENRELEP